ncbi:glycosyltransferase [candidate division KSB1 bacterium]
MPTIRKQGRRTTDYYKVGERDLSLISVIIPILGEGIRYMEPCLKSVFNSTYRKTEVIIVSDDIDGVRELTEPVYGEKIQYVGTDVATLPNVRNIGIEHSRGDLIALMDVKDVTGRMRLELEVLKLEANDKAGLAFCGMTNIDADGKFLQGVNIFKGFEQNKFPGLMYEKNRIDSVSTTLIKSEVIEKIGLFDEQLGLESEYDFWLRAVCEYQTEHLDLPLLRFRICGNGKTDDNEHELRISEEKKLLLKHNVGDIAERVSRVYENEELFRMSLGCVLFRMDKKKEALKNFQKVISINEKNSDAYCLIGDYYLNAGKYSEAKSYYKETLCLNPNHTECKEKLDIVLVKEKEKCVSSSKKAGKFSVPYILCSVSSLGEKIVKSKSAVKV